MKLYYRISDKSYEKQKLIGATKEVCLLNCLVVFRSLTDQSDFTVIADNCNRKTVQLLENEGLRYKLTELGNAGSFRKAVELALEECADDELVYFVEDDYIHQPNARVLLEEGIKRADYVTLYDHPDKYTRLYNGGEFSKVIKTPSSHWRYTASTCMTFATKKSTLAKDLEVWKKHTSESHPHDHHIFTELGKLGRRLAVCIPGAACHTDLTFSGSMNQVLLEPWAIEMMIKLREIQIENYNLSEQMQELQRVTVKDKTGWERLVSLDAFLSQLSKG